MSRENKKQRHNAKRKAKRREEHKRNSISPVKRLADAPGPIECWMSDDFESFGQVQIFAYKQAAGLSGVACFLVDKGVVGLKDCWTRLRIDRGEFNDMLEASKNRNITMRQASIETARRLVAGAVRWTHENGMRLPKDWTRTASLIGGVGDWMSADVSAFVKEFVGHPDDLRQRLISQSLETFLQRTDIKFIFGDAPYKDQETGLYENNEEIIDEDSLDEAFPREEVDELTATLQPVALELASQTSRWLGQNNRAPSPGLSEAWASVLLARLLSAQAMPGENQQDIADFSHQLLDGMKRHVEPALVDEYEHGIEQVLSHLQTDLTLLKKAVQKCGLDDALLKL